MFRFVDQSPRAPRRPHPVVEPLDVVAAAVGAEPPAELARHVDRLALAAGSVVTRRGSAAREAVVLVAGELVPEGASTGPGFGPGAIVGASEALDGRAHDVTLTARTPVELVVVEARALRSAAAGAAGFGSRLRQLAAVA